MSRAWLEFADRAADDAIRERRDRVIEAVSTFGTRVSYEFRSEVLAARQSGRQSLLRWEDCRKKLTSIWRDAGFSFSRDQESFIDLIRNSMIIKMYGGLDSAMNDLRWLREKFAIAELHDNNAITFPRRHGKTLTSTFAGAVTALTQLNGNVYGYNPLGNQAHEWLAQARDWLELLRNDPAYGFDIVSESRHDNDITIRPRALGGSSTTRIAAYGSASNERSAQGLRGSARNAFLIFVDEFWFIAAAAWRVILPGAANGAALVAVSSKPQTKTHNINLLSGQYPDLHQPVWHVLDWRPMCQACLNLERTRQAEVVCRHLGNNRPPEMHFRSESSVARLAGLMAPFGAYEAEMLNLQEPDPEQPVFDPAHVDACVGDGAHLVSGLAAQTHFFVSVDPGTSRASGRSDTAITSGCFLLPTASSRHHHQQQSAGMQFIVRAPFLFLYRGGLLLLLLPPPSSPRRPPHSGGLRFGWGCSSQRRARFRQAPDEIFVESTVAAMG